MVGCPLVPTEVNDEFGDGSRYRPAMVNGTGEEMKENELCTEIHIE